MNQNLWGGSRKVRTTILSTSTWKETVKARYLPVTEKLHSSYLQWLIYCLFLKASTENEDILGLGQYDDFQTIDWQRDLVRDRMRHRYIVKHKNDSLWDTIKSVHDAWSGWLCVFLVGLASGIVWNYKIYPEVAVHCTIFHLVGTVASIIDIGTIWMTDLKYGICLEAFWLDREQCCWASPNQTTPHNNNCTEVTWIICCWVFFYWI